VATLPYLRGVPNRPMVTLNGGATKKAHRPPLSRPNGRGWSARIVALAPSGLSGLRWAGGRPLACSSVADEFRLIAGRPRVTERAQLLAVLLAERNRPGLPGDAPRIRQGQVGTPEPSRITPGWAFIGRGFQARALDRRLSAGEPPDQPSPNGSGEASSVLGEPPVAGSGLLAMKTCRTLRWRCV
jgi:hypothetical protein